MPYDIVVRDLHYAYPSIKGGDETVPVLQGVDFRVARGEFVVLLGRVGAGKTTLCMALNGLVPHATGGRFRGDVTVLDLNTKQHTVPDLARQVGLVFQDPEIQLTQMRVEDEIAFGPENLGVLPAEIEERVTWALDAVGLSDYRDRSPLLLSGGQKQRVAIAAMLAMRPSVLVLDEPTASLDPRGKAAVFKVLTELSRERRVTIFMSTQELEWVPYFADRILVLHGGRVALEGESAEVFRRPARLQEWGIGVPQIAELAHLLRKRTGRAYRFSTLAGAYRKLRQDARRSKVEGGAPIETAEPVRGGHVQPAGTFPQPLSYVTTATPGCPAITLDKVSYRYRDGTAALRGISLGLTPGDFVALLGPNGSGKTTLARQLNGLLKPTEGRVLVGDRDTRASTVALLARSVGYVFQNPDHQIFAPTVREEIAFGPRMQGLSPQVVAQRVAKLLDRFGLTAHADTPPASLGFPQRRQVALASVLASEPEVLILDEPTGGLDARSRQEMMAAVVEFNASCRTVVLITHDMSLVADYAFRAIVLKHGRVLFEGTTPAFFSRRDVLAQAGLAAPSVKLLARRLSRYGFNQEVLTPADFVAEWQIFLAGAPSREKPERSPTLGESASPRVGKPE